MSALVQNTSTSSTADVSTLKRELETAQETIHSLQSSMERLQKEASTVSGDLFFILYYLVSCSSER